MTFKLNNILLLPFVLMFFPSFAFFLPGVNGVYLYFFIVLYICIGVLLFLERENLLVHFFKIVKKTPLKLFLLVLTLMIVNSLFLIIIGKSGFSIIRTLIMQIGLFIFPIIFYFSLMIGKYISYKNFIKLFLTLFWINLNIGFLAYIGQLYDIQIINSLFDFFSNERILGVANSQMDMQVSNYMAFGMPRLDNLFAEPGFYAQFLYIFLPLIYVCAQSNFKISQNIYLNLLIKKTLIPYTWMSIILTFSPIYLILSLVITVIFYYKKIFELVKKYYILIIVFLLIVTFSLSKIDFSETYISRIINMLTNVKSFEDFVYIEPSLATRVVSYINTMIIFFKHPFTGVGLGNISSSEIMFNQYLNSPVPLTGEIIAKTTSILYSTNRVFINRGYIYSFLAENGIFISSLLIYFYINLYICLNRIKIKLSKYSIEYKFLNGLYGCLVGVSIILFYNLQFLDIYLYLVIVLIIMFIYKVKKYCKKD